MGIPPAVLFRGMSDDTVQGLYADPVHLDATGQAYFTRVITPMLLQVYDENQP